jgi:hypothetical protein
MELQVIGHSHITENIGDLRIGMPDYSESFEISGSNKAVIEEKTESREAVGFITGGLLGVCRS